MWLRFPYAVQPFRTRYSATHRLLGSRVRLRLAGDVAVRRCCRRLLRLLLVVHSIRPCAIAITLQRTAVRRTCNQCIVMLTCITSALSH